MRSAVPWNGGAQKRDLGGTQTRDTQNRNPSAKIPRTISVYRHLRRLPKIEM